MLLLDMKDLRAMLSFVGENAGKFTTDYGNVSAASIGAIQRGLLGHRRAGRRQVLRRADAEHRRSAADRRRRPRRREHPGRRQAAQFAASSTRRSCSGCCPSCTSACRKSAIRRKPKLVFFFDEAHLLFEDAPDALVEKIEQVVRLIRSKGVGVYFVTQNPLDIPETVLGQLGNRVQHALRAFTPRDQKAVRTAAQTLRPNPAIKTEEVITRTGASARRSCRSSTQKGAPAIVERAWILPPASRIGPLTPDERAGLMNASVLRGHYEQAVDRESAYEKLQARANAASPCGFAGRTRRARHAGRCPEAADEQGTVRPAVRIDGPRGGHHEGMLESAAKSAARSMGSGMGRQILRGVLGSMFGGKR